jgi:hypothetical protein
MKLESTPMKYIEPRDLKIVIIFVHAKYIAQKLSDTTLVDVARLINGSTNARSSEEMSSNTRAPPLCSIDMLRQVLSQPRCSIN